MRCLVTGSVGFIGSHLVNYLKARAMDRIDETDSEWRQHRNS